MGVHGNVRGRDLFRNFLKDQRWAYSGEAVKPTFPTP